jgi:aminoglycoside phosphotransferase (APT) family kinase protein
MPPYFTEPPALERRPPFSAVPPFVTAQIERHLGGKIAEAKTLAGGMLPAATFHLSLADGRTFFVKGAQPGDVSHATQNIRQEAGAYAFLASRDSGLIPRFYGLCGDGNEDGWLLGVWDFINGAAPAPPAAAFSLLTQIQKTPCGRRDLPGVDAAPYLQGFFTPEKKWRRLENPLDRDGPLSLFIDREMAARWLDDSLPALLTLQGNITHRLGQFGLMHGDARAEHFLSAPGGGRVIDWANASYGPLGFDALFLTLDLSARTGTDFSVLWETARGQGIALPARDDLLAQLACFCGYFMTQAHRPVPDGLPRLRWMQKSILRAGLLALRDLGVFGPVPEFLR